ncbi:MAG TPA: hypothetical protein VHU22_19325 [Xanthobacteraceae bacterium]|nr:hypothetical protein [Xanthobacteraceae bacterium]
MRAEVRAESDVAWLVEGADEVTRFDDGAEDGGLIARIGAHIAVAKFMCREQGCAA